MSLMERRAALQDFIDSKIQPDLEAVQKHLQIINQRLGEYQELLDKLRLEELSQEQLVDIGGDLFAKFNLCDPRLVSIAVGLGYFVEMPIDDPATLDIIRRSMLVLERRKEACLQKEALIKEHLGIMQAGLAALNEYESNQ